VLYDGVTIPFPDKSFDWVICNSVIEHVPPEQRQNFSSEIRRVGRQFVVQTPAWAFPIEPHFVSLFPHWLPRRLGKYAARFGVAYFLCGRDKKLIDNYFDEVHLLKRKEFQGYFPNATIITERLAAMPKSYLAIGQGSLFGS
jgi:Methyltransferase domain